MRRALIGAIGVGVGIALGGAGMAFSAIPDPNGFIHGCVNTATGALRVIDPANDETCTANENPLNFNQQGPQGVPGKPGTPAVKLFARLSSTGTVRGGSGVTTVSHNSTGIYDLTFAQDVTNCAATASVDGNENTGDGDGAFPGSVVVEHGLPANEIDVFVFNTTGPNTVSQDAPLSVIVAC